MGHAVTLVREQVVGIWPLGLETPPLVGLKLVYLANSRLQSFPS